jgi:hypothetical protein
VATATEIHLPHQQAQVANWSSTTRVAFRFCFLYFSLYCVFTQIFTALLPLPKIDIPDLSTFFPMRQIVIWTALHIFHTAQPPSFADTGSGDKTFDWVLAFCLLVIAAIGTAVWSALDLQRPAYLNLHKWFRIAIRFCLAGQMFVYGLIKVVPIQMPFPFLTRLVTPFGTFSPMNVLWSSIGASPYYERFAGSAELFGGLLLLFPRTTTLGALVCMADMTQVFMLKTLTLTRATDKNWKAAFSFERPAPDRLILDGAMDSHKTRLQLKLVDRNSFLLVSRGFHWISEVPFNR